MKSLFMTLILSFFASANCEYELMGQEYNYEGYPIIYDRALEGIMKKKGFQRVESSPLKLEVLMKEYQRDRFHRAFAKISLSQGNQIKFSAYKEKLCLTMLCSVSAVARNLNSALKRFERGLKSCK